VAQEYENFVGRSGKFTSDGSSILSEAEKTIVPKGWQVFFDDDNLRDFAIEWNKGEHWQKYLDYLGEKYYIAVIIDGSNRRVYFAKPSGMFESGNHVLNSNSLVHSQNNVLKDIIRRSEVNLSRYEQRQIAMRVDEVTKERERLEAALQDLELKKAELSRELGSAALNPQSVPSRSLSTPYVFNENITTPVSESNSMTTSSESSHLAAPLNKPTGVNGGVITADNGKPGLPPGLPSHSTPGSEETLYKQLTVLGPTAMPTVEGRPYNSSEIINTDLPAVSANIYADSGETYNFKIYQGLVIADNLKRFSEFIDYDIQLKNIPQTCDFESYANETITGKNKLAMFREYANRYFFSVDAQPAVNEGERNLVVLTYNGDSHVFEGCMK
jgi:hypothetical protein